MHLLDPDVNSISSKQRLDRRDSGNQHGHGDGRHSHGQEVADSTPTTSSSVPSSSSTGHSLQFLSPENATICDDLTFLWNYTGQTTVMMTLFINDNKTVQNQVSVTSLSASPTSTSSALRTLGTDIPSVAGNFTWHNVDVTEGWYVVSAVETTPDNGISAQSPPFFVGNSTDISCFQTSSTVGDSRHLDVGELAGIVLGAVIGVIILTLAFLFPRLCRRALPSLKKNRQYVLY